MRIIKYVTFIFIVTVTLWSCYQENEEELFSINTENINSSNNNMSSDTTRSDTNSNNRVSFSQTIAPIISNNCATSGCHRGNAQFPNLENYQQIKSRVNRIKARAVDQQTMPPINRPDLTPQQISDLSSWINDGAPNN